MLSGKDEIVRLWSRLSSFAVVSGILVLLICGNACAVDEQQQPYKVGPEDTIRISVARHQEFSGEFFVPTDGLVELPGVGQVNLSGKTLSEISRMVSDKLSERLREPEVSVSLSKPRMQRVYVLGAVTNAGLYDTKPGWRITEAVAAAGGLASGVEVADCRATVLRADSGVRESYSLKEVFSGEGSANVALAGGDVLTIEAEETIPVYVMGQVKTPGTYRLRKDSAGVLKALALAGGTLEDAAVSRVSVTHLTGEVEVVNLLPALLNGKQENDIALQAGDLVVVPQETARFAVLGYVNEPSFYPLRDGQKLTLSEALGMAKGADNRRGEMGAVAVIRTEGGKQQNMVFDLNKFLKTGDISQNPEIRPGDVIYVPQTSKPDWQTVFSAISSVGLLLAPMW